MAVWIAYGVIHFSFFILQACPYFVRKGIFAGDYGRPVTAILVGYFFFELILGVTLIIVLPDNTTLSILSQATLAALFAGLLFMNLIANEHTAINVEIRKRELEYVKEASSQLVALSGNVSDTNLSRQLESAHDLIRSSQSKSSHEVRQLELDILTRISELKTDSGDLADLEAKIKEICRSAEERNRKLKLLN